MSDIDHEDDFDKAFEGFGEDPATPQTDAPNDDKPNDATPEVEPKDDDQPVTPPKDDAPSEQPKDDDQQPPEPAPLTKDDITSIIRDIQVQERSTGKELDNTTNEVLEAYYPEGLSNVLIDESTGKPLRTPQDVVDATGGSMDIEQAQQWLMSKQYELDTEIEKIKSDARRIAETTINFKRDSIAVLEKYEGLFKWQPSLQKKVFDKLMQQVKADNDKGVILSSPDVMDHYDFYLEPYQKAYEFSQQSASNSQPTQPPAPPKPNADDRLDDGGDGGSSSEVDDPNDFAQQVKKELAKGI